MAWLDLGLFSETDEEFVTRMRKKYKGTNILKPSKALESSSDDDEGGSTNSITMLEENSDDYMTNLRKRLQVYDEEPADDGKFMENLRKHLHAYHQESSPKEEKCSESDDYMMNLRKILQAYDEEPSDDGASRGFELSCKVHWLGYAVCYTPAFSLMMNGCLHGFFQAKKGIRQGDPMSPLLFVLAMEYLTRLLKKVGAKEGFRYHSRCKDQKLNHLVFADDIMIFTRGDSKSIDLAMRALHTFSKVSGLHANCDKTAVYFGNVPEAVQDTVLRKHGFVKGEFPFRYLGVPLNTRRLKVSDFDPLIDKITRKIQCWSSRHLSYAARTVLVNSVLMSLHTYWAQVMILPKSVMMRIVQLCRAFLWSGQASLIKNPPIAWDWVCKSKKEGDLGIKDCITWNIAALGKYVWQIALKADSLWVKWVHSVYIKEGNWWVHNAPTNASWGWKMMCGVRDRLKSGFQENKWEHSLYTIAKCYKWLKGNEQKVQWTSWV